MADFSEITGFNKTRCAREFRDMIIDSDAFALGTAPSPAEDGESAEGRFTCGAVDVPGFLNRSSSFILIIYSDFQ